MSRIVGLTAAACVGLGLLAAPAAAETVAQYQIIDLGLGDNSSAVAINQFGHVVGTAGFRSFLCVTVKSHFSTRWADRSASTTATM
jgi:hypothetical protein